MKKILIVIFLLFVSLPVFSAPNYKQGCNDNSPTYDNSEIQEYYDKLVDNYHKKYTVKVREDLYIQNAPINAYNNEVIIPLYEFIGEQQRKGKTDGIWKPIKH